MEKKYYYVQGMCDVTHYNSFNPVQYESSDVGQPFVRMRMDCHAIANGNCQKGDTCPLLNQAPDTMDYEDWHLMSQKAE